MRHGGRPLSESRHSEDDSRHGTYSCWPVTMSTRWITDLMLAEHVERGARLSIACLKVPLEAACAFGVMRVDEHGRVQEFVEKPEVPWPIPGDPSHALVSMGIYAFDAESLYVLPARRCSVAPSRRTISDATSYRSSFSDGERVYAHLFADSCVNMVEGHPYWRDVGTVDAFWEANMDLTRVAPELNMYDPQWPIRTLEEHLPPAKFVFESPDPRGQAFQSTGLEWLHRERRFPHTLDGPSPALSSSAAPSSRIRCCCPRSVSVATSGFVTPLSTSSASSRTVSAPGSTARTTRLDST